MLDFAPDTGRLHFLPVGENVGDKEALAAFGSLPVTDTSYPGVGLTRAHSTIPAPILAISHTMCVLRIMAERCWMQLPRLSRNLGGQNYTGELYHY